MRLTTFILGGMITCGRMEVTMYIYTSEQLFFFVYTNIFLILYKTFFSEKYSFFV